MIRILHSEKGKLSFNFVISSFLHVKGPFSHKDQTIEKLKGLRFLQFKNNEKFMIRFSEGKAEKNTEIQTKKASVRRQYNNHNLAQNPNENSCVLTRIHDFEVSVRKSSIF